MSNIQTDEQLPRLLTPPSDADVDFARRLRGDTVILGAGGKMGPTLSQRLARARNQAGPSSRERAVSGFQSKEAERELKDAGIETISCDLIEAEAVKALPQVENVLFLAGRKFGSY